MVASVIGNLNRCRPALPGFRSSALGYHALDVKIAGRAEQIWPNLAPFQLTDEDALRPALQRPGDVGLAQAQWQLSHAVAPRAEFPKA